MAQAPLNLSFDPDRKVVTPRDASTVLVLRDRERGGIELYCVQRHARSPFLGGAIVFPGGKVDASDGQHPSHLTVHARAAELGHTNPVELFVAAGRELLEEAHMLPAATNHAGALAIKEKLGSGARFHEALDAYGVRLETERFVPFARWVTPEAEPRRFDARFFLLRCPDGQEGMPDKHETTLGFWASPREVLERFMAGDVQLAPPTTRSLELLVPANSVEDAMGLAARQSLRPVCPLFVPSDPWFLALPGDPAHAEKERIVAGPTRFVMRDGKLVSEEPSAQCPSR